MDNLLFGTGTKKARIMFVSDMCSRYEYKANQYMIGDEGDLLKTALQSVGISLDDCYFTGYVKECPEDNEAIPTKQQIVDAGSVFEAELKIINPEIIVPLDNVALKKIYGVTGITKYRGKAEVSDGRIIFPMIHPKYLFLQPKHTKKFITDVNTLKTVLDSGMDYFNQEGVTYRYLETYEEVEAEIERLKGSEWLCYDLETTGLNPFLEDSKIVCISMTDRTHYGVTIPLEHNEFKWAGVNLDKIIGLLKQLLEDKIIKKMAYNGKFDNEWLQYLYGINVANFKFDPMLAHYLCVSEEQGGHSLKNLSWEYTDMGGYENGLDKYKETLPSDIRNNYYYIKWEILREYASADVDCTFRLFEVFKPILDENPKWKYIFEILLMNGSDMLKDMEIAGAHLNLDVLKEYEEAYPKRIQEIEDELRSYPEVLEIEREKFALYQKRQMEMKKPKAERDPEIVKIPTKYKNFKFNFGSVDNLKELFFVKLGLDTPFLTDKGKERKRKEGRNFKPTIKELSTGAETLDYLADKHPITKLLAEWRALEKVYGTYVAPARGWLGADGLVHSTYMLHGTVTGRLASEKPNCQNFPRKCNTPSDFQYKHGIKKMFTSRFGDEGVMVQFDYSQLELRVTGMFSGDEGLLGAYNSGLDIHRYTSSKALKVPYDEVTSDQRTSAKAINFG